MKYAVRIAFLILLLHVFLVASESMSLAGPALADSNPLSFVDPAPLVLVPEPASADARNVQVSFVATILGSYGTKLCFSLQLQNGHGDLISPPVRADGATDPAKGGCLDTAIGKKIRSFALHTTLDNPVPPLSGFLIVEDGSGSPPISRPVKLGPPTSDLPKPDVSFVDSTQSTLLIETDGTRLRAPFVVVMANKGTAGATLCFSLQLQDEKGHPVKASISDPSTSTTPQTGSPSQNCGQQESKQESIGAAENRSYSLQTSFENFVRPLSGFLTVQVWQLTGPKASVSKPVRVVQVLKTEVSPRLLWFPVGSAMICVLIGAFFVRRNLASHMGQPTWDFSQSWVTNLTALSTLLTTLAGFSGLPDYGRFLSKSNYMLLGILFAALVALAPVVYSFSRRQVKIPVPDPFDNNNMTGTRLEGSVFGFLVATFMMLWGLFGEFTTLWFLLQELMDAGFPHGLGAALRVLIVLVWLFLLAYGVITIRTTVAQQVTHRDAHRKLKAPADATVAQLEAIHPPLPKWSML